MSPRRPEWFQPFCEPGSECRSRLIRRPYLRAHCIAFRKYLYLRQREHDYAMCRDCCHARPGCLREERLVLTDFDGPVGDGDTHEVEARGGDLGEICLGLPGNAVNTRHRICHGSDSR